MGDAADADRRDRRCLSIFTEMVHDARIVPLDGRDPLPDGIRQWTGSSRAGAMW